MTRSYSQHKEDEILDFLTGYKPNGFYIDVGANDPNLDSVTRYFYEKGWHGINIEPLPRYYSRYQTERSRDINLSIAIGNEAGNLKIYEQEFSTGGLSTALTDYADKSWKEIEVPIFTLSQVCDSYIENNQQIDFLKIDVEGYEYNVIKGMNWQKYRPTAICIEFVKPGTTVDVSNQWEYILLENNYRLAKSYVSNKFYIRS